MPLETDEWTQVEALLPEVLALAPSARAAFLERRCASAPRVRAELESLAAADDAGNGLLTGPVALRPEGTPNHTPSVAAGSRLGAWQISDCIGRGGMGEVFAAERADGQFSMPVAIKVLKRGLDTDAVLDRFARERQILGSLSHPNIARLLDAGTLDDGRPYLVMERVNGTSISRHVRDKALGVTEILSLFIAIADAVAEAHRSGVVHRDLKPSNVLVTDQGQIKLLDFGIAKLLDEGNAAATRTSADAGFLTPAYAAPEQILAQPVTAAADVYALGVMLYQLLTRKLPHLREGMPVHAIVTALRHETAQPPSLSLKVADGRFTEGERRARLRGIDRDLDWIVLKTLAPEPARRYPDAQALADDLRRHLARHPVHARPDSRLYRARRFVQRYPWPIGGSAAVSLALGIGAAVALWQAQRAEAEALRAAQTRDFVVQLFNTANPMKDGRGTQLTAVDLLKSAAERVRSGLADAPRARAELQVAIATSLKDLGEPQTALELVEPAIATLEKIPAAVSDLADALHERGAALYLMGRHAEAAQSHGAALRLLQTLPGDHALDILGVRNSLAAAMQASGDVRGALVEHQALLTQRARMVGDDSPELAVNWNNIAAAELDLERYTQAEQAYARATALLIAGSGPDNPRTIWTRLGHGRALVGLGRYDDAEVQFAAAEQLIDAQLGPDHPIRLSLLLGRAARMSLEQQHAQARPLLDAAWRLAQVQSGTMSTKVETQLARNLIALGHTDEAQAHLRALGAQFESRGQAPDRLQRYCEGLLAYTIAQRDDPVDGSARLLQTLNALDAAGESVSESYAELAMLMSDLRRLAGDEADAQRWQARSEAALRALLGPDHPRTAQST